MAGCNHQLDIDLGGKAGGGGIYGKSLTYIHLVW